MEFGIAWKEILLVTEVHTRRRRGCPRIDIHHYSYQPGRLYLISLTHTISRCTVFQTVEGL